MGRESLGWSWAATMLLCVSSLGSAAANESVPVSAADAAAIAASENEMRAVYGRVKDVVWEDGGRKAMPGEYDYFFVFFEGNEDFALQVRKGAWAMHTSVFDADAQGLIGELVRAETRVFRRPPQQKNPLMPQWHMLIGSPFALSVVTEAEWPAGLGRPAVAGGSGSDRGREGRGAVGKGPNVATAKQLRRGIYAYEQGDYESAHATLQPLAEQGVAGAQQKIGAMYHHGYYVSQDQSRAVEWMKRAARQQDAKALNDLGVFYHEGNGVPKSFETAAMLYYHAADQGHCVAQLNIGGLFFNGDGVEQDDEQASHWFSRASKCGDARASREGAKWLRAVRRRSPPSGGSITPCVPCSPMPDPTMAMGSCVNPGHPNNC